jgi:hypothetical protein
MTSKKESKPDKKLVPLEWTAGSPVIPRANAFHIIYSDLSAILAVGIIDPVTLIKGSSQIRLNQPLIVHTLARFSLDRDDFMALKGEVDRTYAALRNKGVVK